MKITHVAEIVNITNVAGILEAEFCGAENLRAVLMYNHSTYDFELFCRLGTNLVRGSRFGHFRGFGRFEVRFWRTILRFGRFEVRF